MGLIKFRPRRVPTNDVEFGGKKISAKDAHYLLAKDGDKAGIVLFFDGYKDEEKATFGQIGYLLYFDEALGEYAVETQVGLLSFSRARPSILRWRHRSTSCQPTSMNIWQGRRIDAK